MLRTGFQYGIFTFLGAAFIVLISFVVEKGVKQVDDMLVPCQHATTYVQGKCRCDGTPFNGTYCSNCMCEHGICSTSPTTPFSSSDYGCRCPTQSKRFGFLCDMCNTIDSACEGDCKPEFFGTKCEKICFADLAYDNTNDVCKTMRSSGGACSTCHGHGTCNNGECECDEHWYDNGRLQCTRTCPGTPVCSGHGACTLFGNNPGCLCENGWNGPLCDLPCPGVLETGIPCNNVGICNVDFDANSTSCECLEKFTGIDCSYECPGDFVSCNGHGECDDVGVCTCETNVPWSLPSCKCSDLLTCNGKGQCDDKERCECFGNFAGEFCNECKLNWHGENCDLYCDPYLKTNSSDREEGGFGCFGHGTCLQLDEKMHCSCNLDTTLRIEMDGLVNDYNMYYDSSMNCGECLPDYFPKQWVVNQYGMPADYTVPCEGSCNPASCNGYGTCNHEFGIPGEFLCSCDIEHLDDATLCTECETNWFPLDFSKANFCNKYCIAAGTLPDECDGTIDCVQCNGHGTCTDEGICLCTDGYTGDECQIYCTSNDGLICGGHGACESNEIQILMEHEFRKEGGIPLFGCTCDPQDPVDANSRIDWDEKLALGLVNGTLDPPPNPEFYGETCTHYCVKPPWEDSDECNGLGNCTIVTIILDGQTTSCFRDSDCTGNTDMMRTLSGDATWTNKKGPFCHKQDEVIGCERSTDDCYEILLKQRPIKMRSEDCMEDDCMDAINKEDWKQYCDVVAEKQQPASFASCKSVESFCPARTIPNFCKTMVDYTDGTYVSYKLDLAYEFDKRRYPLEISEIYRTNESTLLHDEALAAFENGPNTSLVLPANFCPLYSSRYPQIDTVRENKQYLCNGIIVNDTSCDGILEPLVTFYSPFLLRCQNSVTGFQDYIEALNNREPGCYIEEQNKTHVFVNTTGQTLIDATCAHINHQFPSCTYPKPCDFNPCSIGHTCENKNGLAMCSTRGVLNSTCLKGESTRLTFTTYSCNITVPDTSCPKEITFETNLAAHCLQNNPIVDHISTIGESETKPFTEAAHVHFEFNAKDIIGTSTILEFSDSVIIYIRQGQLQLNDIELLQACPLNDQQCHTNFLYEPNQWYRVELELNTTHVTMVYNSNRKTKERLTNNPITTIKTTPGNSIAQYREIVSENDIPSPFSCTYETCDLEQSYRSVCSDIIRNVEYPSLLQPKHNVLQVCSDMHDKTRLPDHEYKTLESLYALQWGTYCEFYNSLESNLVKPYSDLEDYNQCREFVDPVDGQLNCIHTALQYNWTRACTELDHAKVPDFIKEKCPARCFNHLFDTGDFCEDRADIFVTNTTVIDTCDHDWYNYCLMEAKGSLQGICSAAECACEKEQYEGISGQSCELHCPMGNDGSACAENSRMGLCDYTPAQREVLNSGRLFDPVWALEGDCKCFLSEGTRACDIECRDCNNATYGTGETAGQIGMCNNARGICECLPPFTSIEYEDSIDWKGKPIVTIARSFSMPSFDRATRYRIRMMQGKEAYITNALEVLDVQEKEINITVEGGVFVWNKITTEAPTEAPTTEAPTTEAPTTESSTTTEAPTTEAPTTEAALVQIQYDGNTYQLCNSDGADITWNGNHNIQEVTQTGYNSYDASENIGNPVHGFESSGHTETINNLGASPGTTRYFVCTLHPTSKFSTSCPALRRRLNAISPLCSNIEYQFNGPSDHEILVTSEEYCENVGCSEGKWNYLPNALLTFANATTYTFQKSGLYYYLSKQDQFLVGNFTVSDCQGVPAYDGQEDWEILYESFLNSPEQFWCSNAACIGGDVSMLANLDGTSARYNYDCNKLCPGTNLTTKIPCNARGYCSAVGSCVCDPAKVMKNTNTATVSKMQVIPGIEITKVSGGGSSLEKTGFRGDDCSIVCPGFDPILSDMNTICSGHGICDAAGQCSCELGYMGTECQFKCPGFEDGDDNVCNGHGTCQFASFQYMDNMFPGVVENCRYDASKANCMLYANLQNEEFTQESKPVSTFTEFGAVTTLTFDSSKCINQINLSAIPKDCSDVPPTDSSCENTDCDIGLITYTRNCTKCGCTAGDSIQQNCDICGNITTDNELRFNVTETPVLFENGTAMVLPDGTPVVITNITTYNVTYSECGRCLVYSDCAFCKTCYDTGPVNCRCKACGTSILPQSVILRFNNMERNFSVIDGTILTKSICTDQIEVVFPNGTNATINVFEVPSESNGMCVSPGKWSFYNESEEKVCITKQASLMDDKIQYSILTGIKEYAANCSEGLFYDLLSKTCQPAARKPMIKTWFYSDIDTIYENRIETTCTMQPNNKLECAICDCFSDTTVGYWGDVLCNSCLKGFGNQQCLKECPGGVSNMCNGQGSCIYGSILETEVYQPADCVCADTSKPVEGVCFLRDTIFNFKSNEPIPGYSYNTEERAERECCELDDVYNIENYCRGIYFDGGQYVLILGYISNTEFTYTEYRGKDHEHPYVMEYSIQTQDNYQQISRSARKNCSKLEDVFYNGRDLCSHYDSEDCSECDGEFTGKDCTILCQKCLLGGTCVNMPSENTDASCICSGAISGLWEFQCCPVGFKVTKMIDWNVKPQSETNKIKITKQYDSFTSNELDAAYWCDPCPGITNASWLDPDAFFGVCMNQGKCLTNRFTMENQCQCEEPWAGLSCMCHSDYNTPFVNEQTPYGCGDGKRCIVTNEEFFIPDLIRTSWSKETFGVGCFNKPINGTTNVITDLKCVEYPNQPKNTDGKPYIEDYLMSFDNNAAFNTYRQMVFNKLMVISREGYADFGRKNNIYTHMHTGKNCRNPTETHDLDNTMWDEMVDQCSILCAETNCEFFSIMPFEGLCELFPECPIVINKDDSYIFEIEERDIRKKCSERFPCHMGEGPCTQNSGCAGSLECTTEENSYFDTAKVPPNFGFCYHPNFKGISCVLNNTAKVTADSLPYSGRMIYDVNTNEFKENILFGRYTPIIMDANDRIILQPETYQCPIGSYAVPGVFTDYGFGMNSSQMVVYKSGACLGVVGSPNELRIPHNGIRYSLGKFWDANIYKDGYCQDDASQEGLTIWPSTGYTLENCASRCSSYLGFYHRSSDNYCGCKVTAIEECTDWYAATGFKQYDKYGAFFTFQNFLSGDEKLECYRQCKEHGYDYIAWEMPNAGRNYGYCWCTLSEESCPAGGWRREDFFRTYEYSVGNENTNTFCSQCPHGQYSDGRPQIEWEQTNDNARSTNCGYFYKDCDKCGGELPNKTYTEDCDMCGALVTYGPSERCGVCKWRKVYTLTPPPPGWTYPPTYVQCQGINTCSSYWSGTQSCPGNGYMSKSQYSAYSYAMYQYSSYYEVSEVYDEGICLSISAMQAGNYDNCDEYCFYKGYAGWGRGKIHNPTIYQLNEERCYCVTYGGPPMPLQYVQFNGQSGTGCPGATVQGRTYEYQYVETYDGMDQTVRCQHYNYEWESFDCNSCFHQSGCKTCLGPDPTKPTVCNSCEACENTRWFKPPCTKCPDGTTSDIGSDSANDCYTYPLNYVMQEHTPSIDQPDDTNYFLNTIFLERGGATKYPIENYFRNTITDVDEDDWVHCFDLDSTHEVCEESEDTEQITLLQTHIEESTDCNVCGKNIESVKTSVAEWIGCKRFTESVQWGTNGFHANEVYKNTNVHTVGYQCGDELLNPDYYPSYGWEGYCGFDVLPTLASNSYQSGIVSNWQTKLNEDPTLAASYKLGMLPNYPPVSQGGNYPNDWNPFRARCRANYMGINNFDWDDSTRNFDLEEFHQFDDRFKDTCGTYNQTFYGATCYSFMYGLGDAFYTGKGSSIYIEDISQLPGGMDFSDYNTNFDLIYGDTNVTCDVSLEVDPRSDVRRYQVPTYKFIGEGYCPGKANESKGTLTVEECYQSCSTWDYFTVSNTCHCGNTDKRHTCDDWNSTAGISSYRNVVCGGPILYRNLVCVDKDVFALTDVVATTLQECTDNCLTDYVVWNGTNCRCHSIRHVYTVDNIVDGKDVTECNEWTYMHNYSTYQSIDRTTCSVGLPYIEYIFNTTIKELEKENITGVVRSKYPNLELGIRINLEECKAYAQANGYTFEFTSEDYPPGCSFDNNIIHWKDADVIKMSDGYCLDDWAYPSTGIAAGSEFIVNGMVDVRSCYDQCVSHEFKQIAILGGFDVQQTCLCVRAPCDNMHTTEATYRMLELQDHVPVFDGYCDDDWSLPNGDYIMVDSIVDIMTCLKACPQNAFVYESGPNEGKCMCTGDTCVNMVATGEGRTYVLKTIREPKKLLDGYCGERSSVHMMINPKSPHDIWKCGEVCKYKNESYTNPLVYENGECRCAFDTVCDYQQDVGPWYDVTSRVYELTDVQYAGPDCLFGCHIPDEVLHEGYCVDKFLLTLEECKQYAQQQSYDIEFTSSTSHAHGCSEKNNKVYWRDLDMNILAYGYCDGSSTLYNTIDKKDPRDYRLCYEHCVTQGYTNIAVGISDDCRCVNAPCASMVNSFTYATYSPVVDRGSSGVVPPIPQNIGIEAIEGTASTNDKLCTDDLDITHAECKTYAQQMGYTFEYTDDIEHPKGCSWISYSNTIFWRELDFQFVAGGHCGTGWINPDTDSYTVNSLKDYSECYYKCVDQGYSHITVFTSGASQGECRCVQSPCANMIESSVTETMAAIPLNQQPNIPTTCNIGCILS